jgi:porin
MNQTSSPIKIALFIVVMVSLIFVMTSSLYAQQRTPEAKSQFGGPTSVGGQLKKDIEATAAVSLADGLLEPYFDFKKRVEQNYGFTFGIDYNALFQVATETLGEDTSAGGVLRMFGQWALIGRDSENTGTFVYKAENRHLLGTDIAPQDLGFETGYVGLTAVPFSDAGWVLTNLFWNQHLLDNRLAFVAGVVDSTDYVDVYGLVSPWTAFSNLAFSTDPTIPAPNQGLGAAVSVMATDNVYVLGGMADANGDPTAPGDSFDSFFNASEYFTHIEIGWTSSYEKRFSDNIHITAWHADERKEAHVPDGWGVAFSFSRLVAEKWEPFVRAGYANDGGALWERSLSVGIGYHTRKKSDLLALGLNWGRPSEETFGSGLDDQYTVELFYRFQLLKSLTITPDVQLLVNPANNPNEDVIAIFGIRARLSF